MSTFEKFIPSIEEDEKYFLAYIIKNPQESNLLSATDLKSFKARQFYNTIYKLYTEDNISQYDINLIQRNNIKLESDYIEAVFRIRLKDREYLNHCVKNIKDYDIKLNIGNVIEKFLTQITDNGNLNYETVRQLANDILQSTTRLDDDSVLRTYDKLTASYRDTLRKRAEGLSKKSYGFKSIDRLIIRPSSAGEMTTLFGMKGSGKSLLVKCIENMLVNSNIPVISINLEMTEESNMDRKISVATNYSLRELLDPEFLNSEDNIKFIEESLERLNEKKNYIYYGESEITLNELDSVLTKAKQYFKDNGVLPVDEYMFVTIDLSEQIEELSGKAGTELKPGVNRLLQLAKKHKCHILNVLQSNENLFRAGKMFSTPESIDNFSLQPEMVEGGSVYAARSRVVFAVNRPLLLKRRFFPQREEEWNIETDLLWLNCVKQNDSNGTLGRTPFCFGDSSFRLIPYKIENNTN